MSERAEPVGGPLWTTPFRILVGLVALGGVLMAWRFAVGLGATTGLSDGYPWGIWIAFDVVTGTALACGGYAVAILVYILNKGRYHPLVRPAVLTSALGYSLAGLAIAVDVGRPWLIWRIPISPFKWNLNSALLEVALCVMAYTVVLWIELSPALLERWRDAEGTLGTISRRVGPLIDRSLVWILAAGLLLPTMHQSSLGTVMLLSGHKLHPLWHTPLVPLLFLVSCVAMGYGVVVAESAFSSRVFGRTPETPMLRSLARVMVWIVAGWGVLRLADLLIRGQLAALRPDIYGTMFVIEMALTALAVMMLRFRGAGLGHLVRTALLIVFIGALYRFDTYLVAYRPGAGWSYFPSVPELFVTVGIVALEITLYIVIVKRFPILAGARPAVAGR